MSHLNEKHSYLWLKSRRLSRRKLVNFFFSFFNQRCFLVISRVLFSNRWNFIWKLPSYNLQHMVGKKTDYQSMALPALTSKTNSIHSQEMQNLYTQNIQTHHFLMATMFYFTEFPGHNCKIIKKILSTNFLIRSFVLLKLSDWGNNCAVNEKT